MTSIIFLFKLVHLNDLFCDELVDDIVEEVDIKGVLKSSIFWDRIGAIRSSLAALYDAVRRRDAV